MTYDKSMAICASSERSARRGQRTIRTEEIKSSKIDIFYELATKLLNYTFYEEQNSIEVFQIKIILREMCLWTNTLYRLQ